MTKIVYNILLADDDLEDIELLNETFGNHTSFNIVGNLQNGQQIVDYLSHNELPDILLTDLYMPICTAFEALDQIASVRNVYALKIIIFSTNILPEYYEKLEAFDHIDFYQKPPTIREFSELPNRILAAIVHPS